MKLASIHRVSVHNAQVYFNEVNSLYFIVHAIYFNRYKDALGTDGYKNAHLIVHLGDYSSRRVAIIYIRHLHVI